MHEYKYSYQDWVDGRVESSHLVNLLRQNRISRSDFDKIRQQQHIAYSRCLNDVFEIVKSSITKAYNAQLLKDVYLSSLIDKHTNRLESIKAEQPTIEINAASTHNGWTDFSSALVKRVLLIDNAEKLTTSELDSMFSEDTPFSFIVRTYLIKWLHWFREQQALDRTEPRFILSHFEEDFKQDIPVSSNYRQPVSYKWLSNPNVELPELYKRLISKQLIHPDNTLDELKTIFTAKPLSAIKQPFSWIGGKGLLAYFIDSIYSSGKIPIDTDFWRIAEQCFLNANNLAQSRVNYMGNKSNKHPHKPKNYLLVDEVLKGL
jgi:hypothetical protein